MLYSAAILPSAEAACVSLAERHAKVSLFHQRLSAVCQLMMLHKRLWTKKCIAEMVRGSCVKRVDVFKF